ncbi:hypothetical protein [Sphingobacterium paludis]|uniref:Uncharacterized protein n=1 Tax=Sphingobacterium paludis TaxID=1476465 RepID=A0A4R7D7I9_9SPHI|nr:hypothetical protein [Sphingobacterium paludis]TDS14966.1 hypothetical protein B0I21_103468 [Sphingobacterium paludis]
MPAAEYLLDGLQLFLGKCGALVGEIFTDVLNHTTDRLPSVKKDATALPENVSDG